MNKKAMMSVMAVVYLVMGYNGRQYTVDGILKTEDPHLSLVHSASYVATYASRSCSVCKCPCKNYCTVCSEMANGSIVALCGLKFK